MRAASMGSMRALALTLVLGCAEMAHAQAPSGDDWAALLAAYATEDGGFRYAALRANAGDRARLSRVVARVGGADVSGYSRDRALAFYLDAYNALVVHAVIERWPIESVMRVPGFFDRARHRVAGRETTLNALENEILRGERFAEPRIHFALNCASASCPPLARTPYSGGSLEAMLAAQTRAFVRRTSRGEGGTLTVSRIFEWYGADFARAGGVRAFVARELGRPVDPAARIRYAAYDWDLNDRP